ncbi:O-antigen ligase family protein [Ectobacillus sp. sgz5001026]|uniref:O-antigen ligase family protein n=1 Tax=Ectobacillus sp. sgz5001026 TaxID=3242473 RepID=UPI0036D221D2
MKKDTNLFENKEEQNKGNLLIIFFAYYIAIFIPQILHIPTSINTLYKGAILLIFLGYFLIRYMRFKISLKPIMLALILFLIQIISFCYSLKFIEYNKYINDNINIIILPLYIIIFYSILHDKGVNKHDLCKFIKYFIVFMIIACVVNIIMNIHNITNFFSITTGYEYNMASFFDNRNTFGIYLSYAIIGGVYVRGFEQKKYIDFVLVLLLMNLLLTLSRTAIISTCVFLLSYYLIISKNIISKLVIIITLSCIVYIGLSIDSVSNFLYNVLFRVESGTAGRDEVWLSALNFYTENNIFFGTGYGVGSTYMDNMTLHKSFHNGYISTLVTGGIALSIFYLLLIVYTVRINLKILKVDHVMGAYFIGIMICYLISALTEENVLLTSSGLSFLISIFVLILPKLYYNSLKKNGREQILSRKEL